MEQPHFIIIGVADRGHTLALGWAGAVELDVDAQRFTGMGDFDHAGDAIVADIAAHVVGRFGEREVDMRFQ